MAVVGHVEAGLVVRRGVRLTRRGRLVVLVLALVLAGFGGLLAASASRAADPAGEPPVAVVAPGDTLWSIASRAGRGDPRNAVERIRRLNGLPDYTVYPGQRLRLPQR